jgi:TM2 domain-containing membrane protein YozV
MSKICEYCSAVVDDLAPSCPSCGSLIFRPGPQAQQPGPTIYNIHHGTHPGYPPPPPAGPYGAAPPPYQPPYQHPQHQPQMHHYAQYAPAASHKSRLVALLLCLFLGGIGVHRFYVGKAGTGVCMILASLLGLITFGILGFIIGIWLIVDLILILCGSFKDADGLPVTDWNA